GGERGVSLGGPPPVDPGGGRAPPKRGGVGAGGGPPPAAPVEPRQRDRRVLGSQAAEGALLCRERTGPTEELEPAELVVGSADRKLDGHRKSEPLSNPPPVLRGALVACTGALKLRGARI